MQGRGLWGRRGIGSVSWGDAEFKPIRKICMKVSGGHLKK